jgi:hypothetical protein
MRHCWERCYSREPARLRHRLRFELELDRSTQRWGRSRSARTATMRITRMRAPLTATGARATLSAAPLSASAPGITRTGDRATTVVDITDGATTMAGRGTDTDPVTDMGDLDTVITVHRSMAMLVGDTTVMPGSTVAAVLTVVVVPTVVVLTEVVGMGAVTGS